MSDPSGLVSGRYRLGDLLGTGGSASVFAAVDVHTGSPVALKILHPHLSDRITARDAFLAEALRAAPLRHPNIVGVLDVGLDDDGDAPLAWIALELAAGSSLSEHIAMHGPLPPTRAVVVVDGVLRALEAAHAIGLVHRDVSPANVMIALASDGVLHSGGVRLLDFGLADAAGKAALGTDDLLSLEATGRAGVLGNVHYMSPEQVRGDPVDAHGDIYQAGALLYFALTGRPPFPRQSSGQTMRAHLTEPPPVPSVTDRRIPRALDRIVVRAMLKDPADRFAAVGAMRAALTGSGALVDVAPVPAASVGAVTIADEVGSVPAPASPGPGQEGGSAVHSGAGGAASDEVTRVLGRTIVPPRASGTAATITANAREAGGASRRVRSRAGTWFGVTIAAIIAAMTLAFAATGSPTASGQAEPTAPPPIDVPVQSEPAAPPEAEPQSAVSIAPLTAVPDLARHTVDEALRTLGAAGLGVGEIRRADSPLPGGTVLESSPAAGARLQVGAAVALIVASGFHSVPDVTGQGRDAAAAMVQAAGFAPSFAYRAAPAGTPAGAILGTDPTAGTLYAVGTSITILEAVPAVTPTPTSTRSTPTPTATPTAAPGT